MRRRPLVAATVALVLALSACGGGGEDAATSPSSTEHHHQHPDNTSLGQPDRPIAGPQGAVPQFVVECDFAHMAADDPIVYPGQPGASHLHVFFGNDGVTADSTTESLAASGTTCDQQLDKAAYWAPALLQDGQPLVPVKSTAYYRPGIDVDPAAVQPFPVGLVMVAGNAGATKDQPVSIVAWTCGTGSLREVLPPVCGEGRNLRLVVTFPDCWDGTNLDSDDHHAHVAYSSKGACPDGYPVPMVQLQFSVEYPVSGVTDGLELASGGLTSGHADFMNGWDQDRLEREIRLCLHRGVVCGITSGRKTG
ncbi:MAG: DUF1996 domain-containing protein [Ilumatobacteraceae bacterium]